MKNIITYKILATLDKYLRSYQGFKFYELLES
jgi:hypothetical protein